MPTRNLDDKLKIERIQKGITSKDKYVEDVLVIWTATKPEGGRVIVGWYKNATVYRNYDYGNNCRMKAKKEDCYLIPVEKRNFQIYNVREIGSGNGFGQSNIWYADKKEAINPTDGQKTKAIKYIENYFK